MNRPSRIIREHDRTERTRSVSESLTPRCPIFALSALSAASGFLVRRDLTSRTGRC